MSYNKLNEERPPSYQATAPPQQGPPPKYAEYPPQGQYPGQQPPPVMTSQPVIVVDRGLAPCSKFVVCNNCHASVSTTVTYEPGILTWLSSGLICLFGCWLGCCLIPFCIDDLQDCKHTCPNCGQFIGMYRRIN